MVSVLIAVVVADKLVGSITRVAKVHGTDIFKVVEAFLGGGRQSVVIAVVVSGDEKEEGIAAGVRAAIGGATILDKSNVGLIAATCIIGAVGGGAGRGTFNEGPLDLAGGAGLVVVMEIILS